MSRSHLLTRGLGLAFLLLVILAGSTDRGFASYAVRPEDKLQIKIFQYPELSGDYTVSSTGTITIAPIGEISVGGLSADKIASLISDRFIHSGLSDKPGTTVNVAQARPIYIMGDVQKPGEYPFRPGLTVLQAVSVAGGWMRFNDPGMIRLERDAITIRGDMRNQVRQYYHLLATQARLNSELALKTDIDFPPSLLRQAKSDRQTADELHEQRSFLNIRVNAMRTQLNNLERTRDLYEREIETVAKQIQSNKVEAGTVQQELDQIKALLARGLTTGMRKAELERTLAQIDVAEQGFETLILRARENITQVDQKMFDLKSTRDAAISAELQSTRLQLNDLGVKFDTNRNLLVQDQLTAPSLVSTVADNVVGTRSLTIVRVVNGKSLKLDAHESTELQPGDVLEVQKSAITSGLAPKGRIPVHDLVAPPNSETTTPTAEPQEQIRDLVTPTSDTTETADKN